MEKQHRYTILLAQQSCKNAEKGLQFMLQNDLQKASQYFEKAILYNKNDLRHYLNRCYCYLRMGSYKLALADAEYVINHTDKNEHSYLANLRAGQALLALEEYEKSEKYLEDATNMNLENLHIKRELMRIKVSHIVSKGFREKDALLSLERNSSTLKAISYLKENHSSLDSNEHKIGIEMFNTDYDDIIYSSDEDEKLTKVQSVNEIVTKNSQIQDSLSESAVTPPPAPSTNEKTTPNNLGEINNNTIWIGNLTNLITVPVLLQAFAQFGRILSVCKPQNASYAFIDFKYSEDAQKALASNAYELMNVIIIVKSAIRRMQKTAYLR